MSYIAVFSLVSVSVSFCRVSVRSWNTWNEDGPAAKERSARGSHERGRTIRMRVAPCWWRSIAAETSSIQMCRETVHAEHRDEVASLSGLAAAVDEYEDAPHGPITVR